MQRYDVIIIGTGAGGGTLAYKLAERTARNGNGKRILVLERGDWVAREAENWDPRAVVGDDRYGCHEQWSDGNGSTFEPGTHYNVGGNTKFYGAALWRMRERDFGALQHHGGLSPAWPVSYDEFEPWYAEAERLYQVHGARGDDPTDPRASSAFPYPPVSHEPRVQRLHDDLTAIGRKPFPAPVGVRLDEKDPVRSACIRCGTCDGFPCLVQAKSDSEVLCIRPAIDGGGVELRTRTKVKRLETSASGREVTSVVAECDGEEVRFSGDVVVVAGGAINSAAMLLASANTAHPSGLANSSGTLGRFYMCHNNSMLLALSTEPNATRFHKSFALADFYFGADDFDYPLGLIQMMGKVDSEVLAKGAPRGTPKKILALMASHGLPFWLTSEDLPDADNRVTLSDSGQICLSYTDNNLEGHRRLVAMLKSMLGHIGCETEHLLPHNVYIGAKIPLAGVAHQCGTARFGTDPKTSVLDLNCKAHDVDNLYVVDSSFFPSSSAVNPALTIIANALRVGDHLAARLA